MIGYPCVFCDKVRAGDYTAEGSVVGSFVPLNPVVEGHRLFIPLEHLMNAAVAPHITGEVFAVAAEYGHRQGVAFNLITSTGSPATQSIFHLHVHYVPRWSGDGLALPWTNQ